MTVTIKRLYKAYFDWCDENHEHHVSEKFFYPAAEGNRLCAGQDGGGEVLGRDNN